MALSKASRSGSTVFSKRINSASAGQGLIKRSALAISSLNGSIFGVVSSYMIWWENKTSQFMLILCEQMIHIKLPSLILIF